MNDNLQDIKKLAGLPSGRKKIEHNCNSLFNCCDCGDGDCGCAYCFSCHACDNCMEDNGGPCENATYNESRGILRKTLSDYLKEEESSTVFKSAFGGYPKPSRDGSGLKFTVCADGGSYGPQSGYEFVTVKCIKGSDHPWHAWTYIGKSDVTKMNVKQAVAALKKHYPGCEIEVLDKKDYLKYSSVNEDRDMNGSHCSCGGTYEQTDEGVFDGVLHCNICGETTKRYAPDAESPGADSTSSSTVITNPRDAAPVTDMLRMFCSAHKNVSFQSHHNGNSVTFIITGPNALVRKIRISINNTIMENKG